MSLPSQWAAKALETFRSLGFFAQEAGLSDAELADRLLARHEADWGEPLDPTARPQLADQRLLMYDAARVWWRDIEIVSPGANAYVEVLQEWAAISLGVLTPEEPVEHWAGPGGPCRLTFRQDGRQWELLHADGGNEFLDVCGLRRLANEAMAGSERRFEISDAGGMPDFVILLAPHERRLLETERDWSFYDF